MSYEYAGTLYDTEMDRAVAQVTGFVWPEISDIEEALENALEMDAESVFAEMADHDWRVDFDGDRDDLWAAVLGKLVWATRDELDMSQAELAAKLGYSQKQISLLESGDRQAKTVVLRALLQMLRD